MNRYMQFQSIKTLAYTCKEDQTASVPADFQHLARLTCRNGWRHTVCFPFASLPWFAFAPERSFSSTPLFLPQAPSVGKFRK